jgi:uncharacterized protein YyaL (SSP411 family)
MVLMKLAAYTGHPGYVDAAEGAVAPLQPALAQAPTGFAWWLCALNFELAPPKEIAIVGEDAQRLLEVVFGEYRPNQVVAHTPVQEQDLPIPLLGDRPQIGGKATAYVCWIAGFSCAEGAKNRTPHVSVSNAGDGASHARSATKRLMSEESRGSGKQTNDSRGNV